MVHPEIVKKKKARIKGDGSDPHDKNNGPLYILPAVSYLC
jgi:hypothetical protein